MRGTAYRIGGLGFTVALAALQVSAASSVLSVADAAEHGQVSTALEMLERGADANGVQPDGMTALHWAAYWDDTSLARRLIGAGARAKSKNRYGVTPLFLACENGNAAMIELLIQSGADPNATLRGGESALMTASRTGTVEGVTVLLEHGADPNARDMLRGQTALMWAAAEGHADVVNALIAAGAGIDARLGSGFTPILFAAREGRIDAMKALIDAGADPNDWIRPPEDEASAPRGYSGAPPFGASALLIAVENGHFELALDLIDAGADPNAARTGYTPLHALTRVRKPGVGDNDPPPEGSGSVSSLEFAREIAKRGADLDARMTKNVKVGNTRLNKLGATAYMLAAQTADADLMRVLAGLGADVTIANSENSTPLHAAAGLGTRSPGEDAGTEEEVLEAVAVALEHGADINAVDDNGETVMHAAAYKNLPRVVEYLSERGADIRIWNTANRFGWTPLVIATGYRFGNFKPSQVTVDAIRRVMIAHGVVPPERVEAKTKQIY